ncbi:hypothetical protein LMH87_005549 [Akanthomyces muscarius]|uniref:Uncharacterized protein n=1 Tax=Akanthomyces muscarius TaxID=2231603 RepID=A0A9W8QM19_AKAMU|nr:hypothetical protein LMH87_005549 [Akanthomyces muscarius]KAJ4163845.1 hypothetical protein LMH87_005549 [Akanthomyces muscarius]
MTAATQAITPPDLSTLLTPILPALPPAAASSDPAPGILPFLAPILRQRVQILSSASSEPWLRLLCYDAAKAPRLAEVVAASSGAFEPHPVSGEVEVDWAHDAETRFRRVDRETLQCLVALVETGLAFRLVHCTDDPDGAADGWRIGEVTVADKPEPFAHFGGGSAASVADAERLFQETTAGSKTGSATATKSLTPAPPADEDDEDDDGYWDRYDATPARTPANNRSPAPPTATNGGTGLHYGQTAANNDEDDYYAQYDDVQPAMDGHDPDEEAHAAQLDPPASGLSPLAEQLRRESWEAVSKQQPAASSGGARDRSTSSAERILLQHPRPASSAAASSNGSDTVARLEAAAAAAGGGGGGMQEQSEFGVRQHVSRSIRSLFQLSRSMGMGRDEFEQMVKTELDVLGMMEE